MIFFLMIYAGMMGSGKTTVGKILSEALGYYFFDRWESIWRYFQTFPGLEDGYVLNMATSLCALCVQYMRCFLAVYSDKLVEQAVGGATVAQIFKEYSEEFFRENEVLLPFSFCFFFPCIEPVNSFYRQKLGANHEPLLLDYVNPHHYIFLVLCIVSLLNTNFFRWWCFICITVPFYEYRPSH